MRDCSSQRNVFRQNLLKTISLSDKIVAQRVENIRGNINSRFKTKQMIVSVSMVLNDSTDVTNTAQLLFIQGVNAEFEVTEESA